jgi:hypothetical protein
MQAGGERVLMAAVTPQPHDPQLRPLPAHHLEHYRRGVLAAVVDGHHLVRHPEPVEHRPHPLGEQRQHVLLVEDGYDNRQPRHIHVAPPLRDLRWGEAGR